MLENGWENLKVCHQHFITSDFRLDVKQKRLKCDAVPISLPNCTSGPGIVQQKLYNKDCEDKFLTRAGNTEADHEAGEKGAGKRSQRSVFQDVIFILFETRNKIHFFVF